MNWEIKKLVFIMLMVFGMNGFAQVSTGVSDDRVSLPEGPGSVMGIGEDVNINTSMGMMNYGYRIGVLKGFPGLTPSLSLSYSSGAGLGVAGIGWSFSMPSIERMTLRGLPKYTTNDGFVASGDQLVRLPNTDPPVYRSRFEGGFVRYTWMVAADGTKGYWVAEEYPNGSKGWFGADSQGNLVADARAQGNAGTFTYYLTEKQDTYGHKIVYTYSKPGNYPLLTKVEWVFKGQGGVSVYSVDITYENRNDKISNCKPGFELLLDKRVKEFKVFSHGKQLARYTMQYETNLAADGFSRLRSVIRYGRNDHEFPVHQTWHYTQSLGTQCDGSDCRKPYITSLGSLGINMKSGDTTLLDINGDGLPDVIDTSQEGQYHRIWINTLNADGTQSFVGPKYSKVGRQDSFDLSSPYCQIMDVDGDGFTDMVNTQTGKVLHNLGTGDWAEIYDLWTSGNGGVPNLNGDFDPSDGQLKTVRFMDYNGDKRVDLIRSMNSGASNTTQIYRNLGNGGFQSDPDVDPIGAGFDSDTLELEDMNGDGLLDPVQVLKSSVRYRLNLGWGKWSDWVEISGFNFTDTQAKDAELEDINGDGMADLVLVSGNQVDYWLNRNGAHFDPKKTITSADIDGDIPTRTPETTVLCSDMNSNGSSDIVWIDSSGKVTYLEIFPVRPNLLTRIENGMGKVTKLDYGTAAQQLADDGGPGSWKYAIPVQVNVVDKLDEWDLQNQVHSIVNYTYHDGYYDGKAKQLRGFERVEQTEPGDADSADGITKEAYDVGHDDPYHKSLLVKRTILSGDKVIQVQTNTYGDCPVAGIPKDQSTLKFPIRYICMKENITEDHEGLSDQSKWVKTEKKYEYDGYGNTILTTDLGVILIGGQGCGACDSKLGFGHPCGVDCKGDELYNSTEYVDPKDNGNRWMLRLPIRTRMFTSADADGKPADDFYSENAYYYDGDAFTGLAAGKATHGTVTRMTQRMETGRVINAKRAKTNADGMVTESLDALGAPGSDEHRRAYTYDDDGLRVVRTTVFLKNREGPYQLQRTYTYDPVNAKPIAASLWYIMRNKNNATTPQKMFFTWDDFGRLTSRSYVNAMPGKPTEKYTYHFASPVSTIIMDARSRASGDPDVRQVKCFDGFGRQFQTRKRIHDDQYLVSMFKVFNTKGDPKKVYQQYIGTGEQCDPAPPAKIQAVEYFYDGLGRIKKEYWPKPDVNDPAKWETRVEYGPLSVSTFDLEDTLAGGEFENTPKVVYTNGLGNTLKIQQVTKAGEDPVTYTYTYDKLDRLSGWVGPEGSKFKQERDLLGNVVMTDDPDRGRTTYEFDDTGGLIKVTDARGKSRMQTYDGDNRITAQWDPDDEAGTKVTYSYDFAGDCTKCTNTAGFLVKTDYPLSNGTHGYDVTGYDVMGKPIYFARMLDGHKYEFISDYDNLGRVHSDTYPDGTKFEYKIDDAARLTSVTNYIDSLAYDSHGQLKEMGFSNGVKMAQAFDDRLMVASIRVTDTKDKAIMDQAYERDRVGHITAILDNVIADGVPSASGQFKMDSLYRLLSATLDPGRSGLEEKLTYSYSPSGRLLNKKSSLGGDSLVNLGDYKYGENGAGPHAVTSVNGKTLTYDKAGNMLTKGNDSYKWDFRGRMIAALKDSKPVAAFDYGDGKKRIIKRVNGVTTYYLTSRFEVRNGTAISYLDIGGDHVVSVKNNGFAAKMLSDLAPATGTDDAIEPQPDKLITAGDAWIAQAVGAGVLALKKKQEASNVRALLLASAKRMIEGTKPVVTWLHRDYRGDTVAETDATGKVVSSSQYYPYGALRYSTGDIDPYGYTGKETDKSTGLVYFGKRYAEPVTGQWTSPDPMFSVAGDSVFDNPAEAVNPYAFSKNNPVSYVDSDGRIANFIIGGIVGGITSMISEAMIQKASGNKLLSKKTIGKILFKGALGFGLGLLTSGASAIVTMGASNFLGGLAEAIARKKGVKPGWAMTIGIAVSGATNLVGAGFSAVLHLGKGKQAIKGVGGFFRKAGMTLLSSAGKLVNLSPSLTKTGLSTNRDTNLVVFTGEKGYRKASAKYAWHKLTKAVKNKFGGSRVTESNSLRRTEKGGKLSIGLKRTGRMRNLGFRRHKAKLNIHSRNK